MADEDEDLDLDLGGAGGDYALQVEMRTGEFLLRYWPFLAGIGATVLIGLLIYGQVNAAHTRGQRAVSAEAARAVEPLDGTPLELAQAKAGLLRGVDFDADTSRRAADALVSAAQAGSGAAAADAYLQAAELYRLAGDTAQQRVALEGASAEGTGVIAYSAEIALANLDLESDVDAGIARFESLQSSKPDYLGQQATLALAGALESLDRWDEALAAYDRYLATWPQAPNVDDVQDLRSKAAGRAG